MTKREISPLKKHIEESPKIRALRERREKARKRLTVFLAVLFATLVGGFVYAARYPKLQIGKVSVEGNQVIDTEDIVAVADTYLAGNYAYVIPHRNAFFYPKAKITAALLAKFPRFKSVTVDRTDLRTVAITVVELRGHALWCGEDTAAVTTDVPCYFTDDSGKIVSLAPDYSGNVYPRFYGGSIDPAADPLGKNFIDAASFQKLLDFESRVTDLGFHVKGLLIGTGDEDTFVLDLGKGQLALVRFLKEDSYGTLVANLVAALKEPALSDKLARDRQNLQYFDLRFENKVYYKFRDDTAAAPAAPDTGPTASYESQLGR